ncbi:MAG: cyclic nucleotide-binding domain-containing protein [Lachnospiraceae bacterium]|nr:cyclic nucleotide-binding domain-containing protein [Lachnospiraceae bacterium]MBR5789381.1 cyclic nucleotide-binding domain-containing protein [Lachnospiraceae bacterium]
MGAVNYNKGDFIARKGDKIKVLSLIADGSVIQKTPMDECILEKGHIVGLAGCDSQVYPADYIAAEDCLVMEYSYNIPEELIKLFEKSLDYGSVFILAALKQVAFLLSRHMKLKQVTRDYYNTVVTSYRDYKYLCSKYSVAEYELQRMEYLTQISKDDAIPEWKERYYAKFVRFTLEDLKDLFKNIDLCVGTIEEAGHFMAALINRSEEYLEYIDKTKSILLADKKNDLFQLMFDLENRVSFISNDKEEIEEHMNTLISFMMHSGLYDKEFLMQRIGEYRNHIFAVAEDKPEEAEEAEENVWGNEEGDEILNQTPCVDQILQYADFTDPEIAEFKDKLKAFADVPDKTATDGDARSLRKWLSGEFYRAYKQAAKNALTIGNITPIISMFLNFGFMDVAFVGGEENANSIMELVDKLFICTSDNVYTFFNWIKSIYDGEREPSINELDLDFNKYVREAVRTGEIPSDKEKAYRENPWNKVAYEIDNVFHSGGRITSGHITTFLPILSDEDLINTPANMMITSDKIKEAIDMVRAIDYGCFYREVMFSDEAHGVPREYINLEILPDCILLPNVGSKAILWQPTADARNNTSARIMMPILSTGDIHDMIIENCGRYRWEMCRKVQGSRWNDVTTPSLTSEYSDYLQYARKNFDLSPEAKEKVHNAIKRARNNYREVFVKDYENWIKFESKGSFRLNKVARNILFNYCPFGQATRDLLKDNPMFQEAFNRFTIQKQRKLKHINTLYNHYQQAGGELTPELIENLNFYEM